MKVTEERRKSKKQMKWCRRSALIGNGRFTRRKVRLAKGLRWSDETFDLITVTGEQAEPAVRPAEKNSKKKKNYKYEKDR